MTISKPNILVRLLKNYVRLIHNNLYYRRFVVIGRNNLPADDQPTIFACNHQNCMNDPLGIVFALEKRHAHFYTRADIFNKPTQAKILRSIGLIPAYRMERDGGLDAIKNNEKSWSDGEQLLCQGQAIVIFPEGKHQGKHWLGEFSSGYTKMAFDAAQQSNFEKEIFIQPTVNHYTSYSHMQSDLAIIFGKPISIAQFYELYKTKPRTAQREVNKLVHQSIESLMLNIKDIDNYEAIDFLRNTYGRKFATKNGYNIELIEDKLNADKQLIEIFDNAKENNPELINKIYSRALTLKKQLNDCNVRDWVFDTKPNIGECLLETIALLILFPLFIISIIPNILVYLTPNLITPKLKDPMFKGSIYIGLSLITIPLVFLITFVADLIIGNNVLIALLHVALLPPLGLFAWYYRKSFIKLKAKFWYQNNKKLQKNAEIAPQRMNLWSDLDKLCEK